MLRRQAWGEPGVAAAAGRHSVVVSSAELARAAEVVSLLRHSHGLAVREWRTEEAQFVLGGRTALLRCTSSPLLQMAIGT